jgi:hypothetical protein
VRTEPSLFSVGGVQSRVTAPVEGFLGSGLVVTATVAELEGVVLLDEGAVVATAPDERSIRPTLGATSELLLAEAAVEALDPASEPQAARPNVTRVHNTALRICERAAKVGFLIDHPGFVKRRQGSDSSRERGTSRSSAAIR